MGNKLFRGSFKPRTKGTKDNPLTDQEKQLIEQKRKAKQNFSGIIKIRRSN